MDNLALKVISQQWNRLRNTMDKLALKYHTEIQSGILKNVDKQISVWDYSYLSNSQIRKPTIGIFVFFLWHPTVQSNFHAGGVVKHTFILFFSFININSATSNHFMHI